MDLTKARFGSTVRLVRKATPAMIFPAPSDDHTADRYNSVIAEKHLVVGESDGTTGTIIGYFRGNRVVKCNMGDHGQILFPADMLELA